MEVARDLSFKKKKCIQKIDHADFKIQTHTLAVELNEAFLILCQLSSVGNLVNFSLQDGDLTIPLCLQGTVQKNRK